jgi:hypothetical protein
VDFFLWGYVEDAVYTNPVTDLQDLYNRTGNATSTITPHMLGHAWIETDYQMNIIRNMRDTQVENV